MVDQNDFRGNWRNGGCDGFISGNPHGVEYLFAAVVLTGIIQLMAGFSVSKFIRIVPEPVMMGFVNGLAIVIFLAQLVSLRLRCCRKLSLDAGQ